LNAPCDERLRLPTSTETRIFWDDWRISTANASATSRIGLWLTVDAWDWAWVEGYVARCVPGKKRIAVNEAPSYHIVDENM
jgi:hypothetical protein